MTDAKHDALRGLTVLVTRAAHQADETSDKLRAHGAEVIALPMIEIKPPESWDDFDAAVQSLGQYSWVIFASANAVDAYFARLVKLPITLQSTPKFATIGPRTSAALAKHRYQADYEAPTFVAESFVENFPSARNARILWPKTNIGRTLIADELRKQGATVDIVYCYRTELPADSKGIGVALLGLLQSGKLDVITLASSQTAKNMRTILDMVAPDTATILSLLSKPKIIAIGPETARAATESLGRCDLRAEEFTVDGIITLLLNEAK